MGFFDIWKRPDIHKGLEEYDGMPDAILLDVRSAQEYHHGHIPCSESIPLMDIDQVYDAAPDKETPIFVYCRSGSRSRAAAAELQAMGYTRVKNIGGLHDYRGKLERGSRRKAVAERQN